MKDNAVSQIPDSKTIHDVGDNTNIGENQSHPLLYRLVNHILDPYALVGVVTNKYQYLTMKYNAVSQIPASKTIHNVGDNTNIGENQSHPLLDRLVNHILDPWPDVQAG